MYEFTYVIPSKLEDEFTLKLISAGVTSFYFEKISRVLYLKIYSVSPEPCEVIDRNCLENVSEIHDSDWKNKWAEGYTGHELTENIFVLPPGVTLPEKKYKYIIQIDPEDSFGDGHHPTTRLCGVLLEQILGQSRSPGELSFLDIGTGSGVLAIQAALTGVMDIELFDYDKDSVVKAEKNLSLNGITGARPSLQDLYTFSSIKKYDIITANLLSKIIEDNIEILKSLLKPDGFLILSGISSKWEEDMINLFKNSGLKIISHKKLEEWEGFVAGLNSL
jgi:ribosomal protein L11 methyltransferase